MKQRQRLDQIHACPLPLRVYPAPAIVVHNPLSVVWYIYSWATRYISSSKDESRVTVYANVEEQDDGGILQSCWVFNHVDMRTLWEMGFFGKGTLSRSEPTWFKRTNDKLAFDKGSSNSAAEDLTRKRRIERARFKQIRGIVERKQLEQRKRGGDDDDDQQDNTSRFEIEAQAEVAALEEQDLKEFREIISNQGLLVDEVNSLVQVERLQLSRAETLFLLFGLDAILVVWKQQELNVGQVFNLMIKPFVRDNSVLIEYIVYHHYRSLGWCVRNGIKFGTDYLLYRRGPPFQHAEYGIIILTNQDEPREWWWSSAIARVVGGVKKTLVLCYITIPSQQEFEGANGIESLVKLYKIREVTLRRWVPNRQRD